MPAVPASFKKAIRQLTDTEKEAIILKAARRDAELFDIISYEMGELSLQELQEQAATRIHDFMANATGRSQSKALAKGLRKAVKEIARFKRVTKDVKAEIDLHLYLLRLIFENYTSHFNSFYKAFYTGSARLLQRTIQLIQKKLHEDYHLEYKAELDSFLEQIHSSNKPLTFSLPASFEVE